MVADPQSHVNQIECRAALEDIVHLTRRICGIWGTRELDVFLSQLLMDARGGARQGLPVEVANEILFLVQTNKIIRAMDLSKKLNLRVEETYRMVDEADQASLKIDALDDPLVSHDTITRGNRSTGASARQPAMSDSGSQAKGLGELLWLLILSKWVLGAVTLFLLIKFVWPIVKPLI